MGTLDEYHSVVSALTLLGVLVLLWSKFGPELEVEVKNAESFKTGSTLAQLYTHRDDAAGANAGAYTNRAMDVTKSGLLPDHSNFNAVSGMLSYEPPVFWNAGDRAAISAAQVAASKEPVPLDDEGMRSRAQYALEGMDNRVLSPY